MKKHDIYSLLNDPERIREILFDVDLYFLDSFFVIDPITKEYDTNWTKGRIAYEKMQYLYQEYCNGKTIIIKNLEQFIDLTNEFGPGIDIHAYVVPRTLDNSGDSFGWHTDDRDVWIKMLWGEKIFGTRHWANDTMMDQLIKVKAGSKFYIPKGQLHKAVPMGPSCLLSVGVPSPNLKDV